MGLAGRIKTLLGDDRVQQLHGITERALEQHLSLAVTGLSRSGKTVFITALTQHLLHADQDQSLPLFTAAAEGRILSCRNLSAETDTPFPFQDNLTTLSTHPPAWPKSTRSLSSIKLAIRYRRPAGLKRFLGEFGTLYLDIIDYPGEWLLDLPLLQCDYAQWCREQQQLFSQSPRRDIIESWYKQQQHIDWLAPASAHQLDQLALEFRQRLQQLREPPHALSLLQPGRLLLEQAESPDPSLLLFPVLTEQAFAEDIPEDSALAEMKRRYQTYCAHWIKPFYKRHFCQFDRQLVLTDCLQTLNQGEACFNDMQRALNAILQNFDYGRAGWLRRLIKPRIERVLFAATKADHVTANQHPNLDRFLDLIIQDARREIRFEEVDTRCMALASIRSTEAAQAKLDGQVLSCLRGHRKESNEEVALFPGEIPVELPQPEDWNESRFRFIDFAPRALPRSGLKPEHHIRLDQALEYLTGDLFR